LCGSEGLDRAMDATTLPGNDANLDLDVELETWDWARAAGVSADELRQALQASFAAPALRKAA
jgi:hypothetical protein